MAHQAGFENVVASLGTALTPAQVALIARYAREIVLAYDVDPAGQHAGSIGGAELFRLIGALAAEETGVEITRVRVARLPEGKDPDEVIRDTPDLWREAIRTAQPIIEYLIDYYATAFDVRTAGGPAPRRRRARADAARDPRPGRARRLPPDAARRTGVEERVLLEALRAPVPVGQAGADGARRRRARPAPAAASPPTRSCRPRTRSTRRPSCKALTLEESASCCGSCSWCRSSRNASPRRWRRRSATCPAPRPASCWRRCSRTASGTARPAAPAEFERRPLPRRAAAGAARPGHRPVRGTRPRSERTGRRPRPHRRRPVPARPRGRPAGRRDPIQRRRAGRGAGRRRPAGDRSTARNCNAT